MREMLLVALAVLTAVCSPQNTDQRQSLVGSSRDGVGEKQATKTTQRRAPKQEDTAGFLQRRDYAQEEPSGFLHRRPRGAVAEAQEKVVPPEVPAPVRQVMERYVRTEVPDTEPQEDRPESEERVVYRNTPGENGFQSSGKRKKLGNLRGTNMLPSERYGRPYLSKLLYPYFNKWLSGLQMWLPITALT